MTTLTSVAAITSGLVALCLAVVLRSHNPLVRAGQQGWTAGIALQAAGWFLAGFRGGLPPAVGVVAANFAIAAGLAECHHALRLHRGPVRRPRAAWVVVAAVLVVSLAFSFVLPDRSARMALNSALLAVLMGMAARAALQAAPAGEKAPPSHRLVAVTFLLGTGVLSLRVLAILKDGAAPPFDGLRVPLWQVVLYASMAYVPVLATLGHALMGNDALNRELARIASRDPLTGLLNRRSLEELAVAALSAADRRGRPVAVALVDADHFKAINDTFGHEAGDVALAGLARLLQGSSRAADVVARWGGEEFLVLMPETDLASAHAASERARARAEQLDVPFGPERIPVRVSIGVAERSPGDSLAETVRRADAALYEAKRLGRNRVETAAAGPGERACPPDGPARPTLLVSRGRAPALPE